MATVEIRKDKKKGKIPISVGDSILFDGRHQARKVTVHNIKTLFDFIARVPFQKQEANPDRYCFFNFLHSRFHTWLKQNYESDPAEISAVADYQNILHDNKLLLRCWRHQTVKLNTYRTALVHTYTLIRTYMFEIMQ